jgi:hypothetical protein
MSKFIDTGEIFTTAIATLCDLLTTNRQKLEIRDIYKYDELMIMQNSVSIVFNSAVPTPKSLGPRCN